MDSELSKAKRSRTSQLSQLTKLYNEIDTLMICAENKDNVRKLFDKLCEKFELFKKAHFVCLELCGDSDSSNAELLSANYTSQEKNFAECKEHYTGWLKNLETPEVDHGSVHSSISMSSSKSSKTQLRSAKAKRLVAEHRLRALREKQKLELEQE